MNPEILNTRVQQFINENIDLDISELILKSISFKGVSTLELAQQIESKRKCKSKLPTWFSADNIYYPLKIHIEQTSSEIAADYKSQFLSGDSILDITGGLGVDCYFFSNTFNQVIHCEINEELSKIAAHNFKCLNRSGIKTISENGLLFLGSSHQKFEWIYADPSRRHDTKGKVFFFRDCLPNIPEHLDAIFENTKYFAIKSSPLLDLSAGIEELKFVKTIHIISIFNEVKELLWVLQKNYRDDIKIRTINITKRNTEHFDFKINEEHESKAKFSKPLSYLYEPNAAVLKAGAFKLISEKLGVFKLHQHSHLYTSDYLLNFPGRQFRIDTIMDYNKKKFKKTGIAKANVTTRNFSESVQQIRKKLNIQEGGSTYLFFTTNLNNNRIILKCSKIEKN